MARRDKSIAMIQQQIDNIVALGTTADGGLTIRARRAKALGMGYQRNIADNLMQSGYIVQDDKGEYTKGASMVKRPHSVYAKEAALATSYH